MYSSKPLQVRKVNVFSPKEKVVYLSKMLKIAVSIKFITSQIL